MPVDPVCGMVVDSLKTDARTTHQGKTIYFCSQSCKAKFEKEPGRFIKLKAPGEGWAPLDKKTGFFKKHFSK